MAQIAWSDLSYAATSIAGLTALCVGYIVYAVSNGEVPTPNSAERTTVMPLGTNAGDESISMNLDNSLGAHDDISGTVTGKGVHRYTIRVPDSVHVNISFSTDALRLCSLGIMTMPDRRDIFSARERNLVFDDTSAGERMFQITAFPSLAADRERKSCSYAIIYQLEHQ